MTPGGCPCRRSRRLFACLLIGGLAFSSFLPAASAAGGGDRGGLAAGESGSGAPRFPSHFPRTALSRSVSAIDWADVDASDAWAAASIDYVGSTNDWMRDFTANADGTYPFRPDKLETRRYFARSVVKAFAPAREPDPTIVFDDLDPSSPFYRYANIAVKLGWMRRSDGGGFMPDRFVTTITAHRVLVLALGMKSTAHQLDALHTRDGVAIRTPLNFGTTLLGMRLGLRYNNWADESMDVGPTTRLTRAQVAFSLARAATLEDWVVPYLADQYDGIELPVLGRTRLRIVNWGVRYVGYPYVWGGEWGFDSKEPAALGGQPIPGFDCSGFTWWLMRANDGASWHVAPPRPYAGWALPQRTSYDMAKLAPAKLAYDEVRPGDLMFYDGDLNGTVDHVDVYIGHGWSLDSGSSVSGVSIMWVGSGSWYDEHFKWGRHILPSGGS